MKDQLHGLLRDWSAWRPFDLSVVIPCHNEERNVAVLFTELERQLADVHHEVIFVDDGSIDGTAYVLQELSEAHAHVRLLRFARNAGQQLALRAGYRAARGRFVASLDADLQHPPSCLPEMLRRAREGYDVVQMIREGRQRGLGKEFLSRGFYRVFNRIAAFSLVPGGSDFRLLSRRACDALNALPERNLVLRAALPWLGFKPLILRYRPSDRYAGKPAYNLRRSLSLAVDTLVNFSDAPLRLAFWLGLALSPLAFVYGLFNVAARLFTDWNVPGYTDIVASVLFLGGLNLFFLGILGRYLAVALDHLKGRPEYIVREMHGNPVPESPSWGRAAETRNESIRRDAEPESLYHVP